MSRLPIPCYPAGHGNIAIYTRVKDRDLVCPSPLSMERYARLPSEALDKRISSLADGDLFRPVGRENEGPGRIEVCLVLA
jgi:hypothetical protein